MNFCQIDVFGSSRVEVEFFAQATFELNIKYRMSTSMIDEQPMDASRPSYANEHGLAATLKTPRLSDYNKWTSPDEFKTSLTSAQYESQIFDASLRAFQRC